MTVGTYTRYADLTGDRSFQSACAALVVGSSLPTPQPALAFGDALSLGYTAATAGWTIGGDGVALSFAAGDAVTASAGQRSYERVVAGSPQRFTITDPVAAGTTLGHVRNVALRTDRAGAPTLYSCVFGTPSIAADVPMAATAYDKAVVTGTAYVLNQNGTVQTYTLSAATATLSYDPASKAAVIRMRLVGNLQIAGGVAATTTELGSYTGTGGVETSRARFSGQIDSADRISLFSSFSGAFFGGTETGSAFEILAIDTATGSRMAVTGTLTATR